LAAFPESGRIVPEIGDPALREVLYGSYRIVYELRDNRVEIATVAHTSRRFPRVEE
jgi:plasmid stabilization system protein ParE